MRRKQGGGEGMADGVIEVDQIPLTHHAIKPKPSSCWSYDFSSCAR